LKQVTDDVREFEILIVVRQATAPSLTPNNAPVCSRRVGQEKIIREDEIRQAANRSTANRSWQPALNGKKWWSSALFKRRQNRRRPVRERVTIITLATFRRGE
jgi:hypothetical protein